MTAATPWAATGAGRAAGHHLAHLGLGGGEIARRLARDLVVPLRRDRGQPQFIATPMPALDDAGLFAGTVAWLQSARLTRSVTSSPSDDSLPGHAAL